MGAQQEHSELLGGLTHLCAGTVTECESALAQQKANDLAEAKRVEEELKLKEEMARRVVEQEEKERQERLRGRGTRSLWENRCSLPRNKRCSRRKV